MTGWQEQVNPKWTQLYEVQREAEITFKIEPKEQLVHPTLCKILIVRLQDSMPCFIDSFMISSHLNSVPSTFTTTGIIAVVTGGLIARGAQRTN